MLGNNGTYPGLALTLASLFFPSPFPLLILSEFDEFLDLIGERIRLLGWQGYNADLDTQRDQTGSCSFHPVCCFRAHRS